MVESEEFLSNKVCINERLRDDELRAILERLESSKDKDAFGLVCKRWLHLQSSERKRLCMRAGPLYLLRLCFRFSRLIELDLSQSASRSFYPGVTDSDLTIVAANLVYLRFVYLNNCKGITDVGLMALGNSLPSLQGLDVSNCRKLTDKGLVGIANGCHSLKSLHLANCKSVTDGLLEALSKTSCHLEELGMQGCIKITNSGLSSLVERCRQIRLLDVNKCSKIGDDGVVKVSKFCSSLKTLKLLDCCEVGDKSIYSLAESCKNLETLVIGGCRGVSDESIKALASTCSYNLKTLRMDWCSNISDSALCNVLSHCKKLEALDIGCCHEISDIAFRGLERGGFESGLKVLKASNCPKITVSGIAMLLEFCKSLEYLDVRSCPHVSKEGCDQAGLQFPEYCKVNFTGSLLEMDAFVVGTL